MFGIAVSVIAADQLTKWWALETLRAQTIDLFWTLRFNLTSNTGLAFSLGDGRGALIGVVAFGIVGAVLWVGRDLPTRIGAVAVGLVVGGALGNLVDRAFRSDAGFLQGAVVDFIDLQWWPVFNVADAAVVVGTILLMVALLLPSAGGRPAGG